MATVEEQLGHLEEDVRKLKIEYDMYFGGGLKRPPADTEWRVQTAFKRMGETHRLNFTQRFKFNSIQQKYALYNSLWQQKLRIKEEGYRRPQDALLGIVGMRIDERIAAEEALSRKPGDDGKEKGKKPEEIRAFRAAVSDIASDHENVERLYNAMMAAQAKSGVQAKGTFESFETFVAKKTQQVRLEYGCAAVEYSVELDNGQVRLKAKAKI